MSELHLVRDDKLSLWHVWNEDHNGLAMTACGKSVETPEHRLLDRLPYTGPRGSHPAWPYRTLLEPTICPKCPWYAELSPERESE